MERTINQSNMLADDSLDREQTIIKDGGTEPGIYQDDIAFDNLLNISVLKQPIKAHSK